MKTTRSSKAQTVKPEERATELWVVGVYRLCVACNEYKTISAFRTSSKLTEGNAGKLRHICYPCYMPIQATAGRAARTIRLTRKGRNAIKKFSLEKDQ